MRFFEVRFKLKIEFSFDEPMADFPGANKCLNVNWSQNWYVAACL
jgi:hypothetical protein